LHFKLSHEQDLNASYLSQIKELQTKLAQTRRAALASNAEKAMTEQLTEVHAELKQVRAEHKVCSRDYAVRSTLSSMTLLASCVEELLG
jgi:hypothetical protein